MTTVLEVIWVDLHPELLTDRRVGAVTCRIFATPENGTRPYVLASSLVPKRERLSALREALLTLRNRIDDELVGSRLSKLRELAESALADTAVAADGSAMGSPEIGHPVPESIWMLPSPEIACYGDSRCLVSTHAYDDRTHYILAAEYFLLDTRTAILCDTLETLRDRADGEVRELAEAALADTADAQADRSTDAEADTALSRALKIAPRPWVIAAGDARGFATIHLSPETDRDGRAWAQMVSFNISLDDTIRNTDWDRLEQAVSRPLAELIVEAPVLAEDNVHLRDINTELLQDLRRLRSKIRDLMEQGFDEVDARFQREVMYEMEPTTALIARAERLERELRRRTAPRST